MKSVVEFLWGSPIITEDSDEDWLIFVDQQINKNEWKTFPRLAGPRSKRVDNIIKPLSSFPNDLLIQPFYNCFCLYSQEYYIDEAALLPFKEIISLKEDISRMNLSEFYLKASQYIKYQTHGLDKYYRPKRMSKVAKNCAIITHVALGNSFEEAISLGNQIASSIKLEQLTHEQSLQLLNEYTEQIQQEHVIKYFQQEVNYTTYEKLKTLIDSINTSKLTGIPVKGPF